MGDCNCDPEEEFRQAQEALQKLAHRLADGRLRQVAQKIKQQKRLDNAPRHTEYQGHNVSNGGLIKPLGGGAVARQPISNGWLNPGDVVEVGNKGGFDFRPRSRSSNDEEQKISQKKAIASFLYKIKKDVAGEPNCTCPNWIFEGGQCQQKCDKPIYAAINDIGVDSAINVLSHKSERDCLSANVGLFRLLVSSGWVFAQKSNNYRWLDSYTFLLNISYTDRESVSGADYNQVYLNSRSLFVPEGCTADLSFSANVSSNGIDFSKASAIGINRIPRLNQNDAYEIFAPGSYDVLGEYSLSLDRTLPPGSYIIYYVFRVNTFIEGALARQDAPCIGTFSIKFKLNNIKTTINTFYLKPFNKPSIELMELRIDDPYEAFLGLSKNGKHSVYLKLGNDYYEYFNPTWCKISQFLVSGSDAIVKQDFSYPNLPVVQNWQADFIKSYSKDAISSKPCFNIHKSDQVNFVGNDIFELDLNQQDVEGIALKDAIKYKDVNAEIDIKKFNSQETTCPVLQVISQKIVLSALDLEEGIAIEDAEIIAVSSLYA